MEEKASDRAADGLWFFLVMIAFLLLLAGIGLVILAIGVAVSDRDFPVAGVLALGAAVCFVINRLIVATDDKRDAKKKKKAEEERAAQIHDLTYNDDVFGRLTFRYDSAEDEITMDSEQLPKFSDYSELEVRANEIGDRVSVIVKALHRIYDNKEEIIALTQERYLAECVKQGYTHFEEEIIDSEFVAGNLVFKELSVWLEEVDGRYYGCLSANTYDPVIFDDLHITFKLDDEDSGYEFNWY
ncbi:MAG: hypothetical protein K6C68_07900 [Ruminococcus sp.]|nr:hypothetical protein [Ruminococcus sp.]